MGERPHGYGAAACCALHAHVVLTAATLQADLLGLQRKYSGHHVGDDANVCGGQHVHGVKHRARCNVIGQRAPWFIHIPCATYLRDIHTATTSTLPEPLRAAHIAGQHFHTLEIAAAANLPQTADLLHQARAQLPAALRADPAADWTRWPMRHRPEHP